MSDNQETGEFEIYPMKGAGTGLGIGRGGKREGAGRPRLGGNKKASSVLQVRVTAEQKARYELAARKHTYGDLSKWIKQTLDDAS